MAETTTAGEVLRTHRISLKNITGRDGITRTRYSIQFTYPKGQKRQFTGGSEEEVRNKVYRFFNVSCVSYEELCKRWTQDEAITGGDHIKERSLRYAVEKFLPYFDSKLAAEVTAEDILDACKTIIAKGCKTNTANTLVRSVKNMYAYAIQKGIADNNPAESVKRFRARETRFERNYLTDRQIYDFLTACKEHEEYMFAVYLVCGIRLEKLIPLRWKDVNFDSRKISITRQMASRTSFEVINLERTECVTLEEPGIAFEYLELELEKQAEALGERREVLIKSDRFVITPPGTLNNTSAQAFGLRLYNYLKRRLKAEYNMADIFHTSAVYAFKAGCDLQSIASIIGFRKAIEMFRRPENYDVFEPRKTKSVNDYFDELYFGIEV